MGAHDNSSHLDDAQWLDDATGRGPSGGWKWRHPGCWRCRVLVPKNTEYDLGELSNLMLSVLRKMQQKRVYIYYNTNTDTDTNTNTYTILYYCILYYTIPYHTIPYRTVPYHTYIHTHACIMHHATNIAQFAGAFGEETKAGIEPGQQKHEDAEAKGHHLRCHR